MTSGFRAEIDIKFTSLSSSKLSCIIGAHNDSSPYGRNFLAAQTSLFQIGMGDGYYNCGSPTTGEKYHIDFSNVYGNAYCKINGIGQTLSEAATGTNSYSVNTLYLLAVHGGEYWFQKVSGNTYHCKIYSTEGTLVRDYIPCQTTSGEIGLWDALNKMFYGNAGTGAFIAGPYCISSRGNAKIGGEYKNLSKSYVKVNGVWKSVSKILGKKDIWGDLR